MSVNSKTRNPRKRKAQAAKRSASIARNFSEEDAYSPDYRTVSYVPTSQLVRHPGAFSHSGGEVAKMLATGQANVVLRDKDAAGPLKEQVGCTVKTLDYIGKLDGRGNDR